MAPSPLPLLLALALILASPWPAHAVRAGTGGGAVALQAATSEEAEAEVQTHMARDVLAEAMAMAAMTDKVVQTAAQTAAGQAPLPPAQARDWLAKGLGFGQHPRLKSDAKAYLTGQAPPVSSWAGGKDWEDWLIGAMESLNETGVQVDDHKGTPIGEGESIGLVAAQLVMDPAQVSLLPPAFQTGLFKECGGACARWPAVVRVSHTKAAGLDLMRISLAIGHPAGTVNLLFTETLKSFPIADRSQLEAFAFSVKHGSGDTLWRFPVALAAMGYNAAKSKYNYGAASKQFGALGKDYYSLTPYLIGRDDGAASAMKWRLVPSKDRVPFPIVAKGQEVKLALRQQLIADISAKSYSFDLEIQVATDPDKHPVNDAAVEWDEETAPWVRMGAVTLPKQAFPAKADVGTVVGSGLWEGHAGPSFNSKELLFAPGMTQHRPIGDINAFRAKLYPVYDAARQAHLLGKLGPAAKCPFASIASWLR